MDYLKSPNTTNTKQNHIIIQTKHGENMDQNTLEDSEGDTDEVDNMTTSTIIINDNSDHNKSNNSKEKNSRVMQNAHYEGFLKLKPKLLEQLMKAEKQYWSTKNELNTVKKSRMQIQSFLGLILSTKHLNFIYEYFNMIQFQKCCMSLQSYYRPFEMEESLNAQNGIKEKSDMNELDKTVRDLNINATIDERMVLYYCTVVSLYPSLYATNIYVSPTPSSNENISDIKDETFKTDNTKDELETTSEGLCDFLREIFFLNRQTFNDYQIKVLKKLLLRKSHAQVLKEEIWKQKYIIETDRHPIYTKENFQSPSCYEMWKLETLMILNQSLDKLSHVQLTLQIEQIENILTEIRYSERLNSFIDYYKKLLNQIFIYLKSINRYNLTNNSKRLLKEFQLRYLIDPFYAMINELNCYVLNFDFNHELIRIINTYLNAIGNYLNSNCIVFNNGLKHFGIGLNDIFMLMDLLSNIEISVSVILKNLRGYYPEDKVKYLNWLLELMEKISYLNVLLGRTSSITIVELLNSCLVDGLKKLYIDIKNKLRKKYFASIESAFDSHLVGFRQRVLILKYSFFVLYKTYSMILFSRDQFDYYNKLASKVFSKYLDINRLVANVLYRFLMDDVKGLCEEHLDELKEQSKINLNLLGLAYRLNQLDLDWGEFISNEKQDWRSYFLPQLTNWLISIGDVCSKTIVNVLIPRDNFTEIWIRENSIKCTTDKRINELKLQASLIKTLDAFPIDQGIKKVVPQFRNNSSESTGTCESSSNTSTILFTSEKSAFKPFKRPIFERQISNLSNEKFNLTDVSQKDAKLVMLNNFLMKYNIKDLINDSKSHIQRSTSCIFFNNNLKSKETRSKSLPNIHAVYRPRTETNLTFKDCIILVPKSKNFVTNKTGQNTGKLIPSSTPISTSSTSNKSDLRFLSSTINKIVRFPCSSSCLDLIILIFRLRDTCKNLIDFVIANNIALVHFKYFQVKFQSTAQIYKICFNLINNYIDNLFILDVCATSESLVNKLFGNEITSQIFSQGNLENVWGCRHKLPNCKYNCEYYLNRVSQYISDLYEPISEMMCIRLNNLIQIRELHSYLMQKFKIQMQDLYQIFISSKRIVVNQSGSSLNTLKKNLKNIIYEQNLSNKQLKIKMNQIRNGLTNLFVHRFNLFCKKTIQMLMSEELDMYPIVARLKPLTDFLICNFEMFRQQCYPNLFHRILNLLWNLFHNNFLELFMHIDRTKNPRLTASKYLQMIDVLMKQFKTFGCKMTYLQLKVNKLKLHLQLYFHDSVELIFLYYKLFNLDYRISIETLKKTTSFLLIDLPHLIKMKKQLKKNFNGKFFISYLKKNPPPSSNMRLLDEKQFDKDSAIKYAQTLMDENYLISFTKKTFHNKTETQVNQEDHNDNHDMLMNELTASYNSTESVSFERVRRRATFNLLEYKRLFLATKEAHFKIGDENINKLIRSLLNVNVILSQEIELLFPQFVNDFENKSLNLSDYLLESCLENGINYDFIMNILWHRIHLEPIVMKFISLRYSNYATNVGTNSRLTNSTNKQPSNLNEKSEANSGLKRQTSQNNTFSPVFPLF